MLESHKHFVKKPNQATLGIKFCIDGANAGQFSDLPVTALKLGLGIHTQECRFQEWAWRTLAWIPQVRKQDARGEQLFQALGHLDSLDVELDEDEGDLDSEGDDMNSNVKVTDEAVNAWDFHAMLSFALKSFAKPQKMDFLWDQKSHGMPDKEIHFVPIVIQSTWS